MLRMLIVDDEYLVRTGIKETIDWKSYGVELIGDAYNGKDGLEKIHAQKPDIVVSDVKMPVMDGMQLVKALYEESYDGIIIILSGYNDFEYAKKTLEKGVFKYLLKPIDNEELIRAVTEAGEKLIKRRKTERLVSDMKKELPTLKSKLADDIIRGNFGTEAELKEKAELYDMDLIEKGLVLYCKADIIGGGE